MAESTLAKPTPSKPVVAVIDDHVDSREVLAVLLEDFYDVRVYPNASEALSRIRLDNPAVILCDLLLPDMTGWDFVKDLRALGISTPAIAISAHVIAGVCETTLAVGFDHFVAKPVEDVTQLMTVIHRFLGHSLAA
jgi:CheY-like chemotaxis protein